MDEKTRNIGLIIIIILIIAIVGYFVFQPSAEPTLNGSTNLSDSSDITQKNNITTNAQGKLCSVCKGSGIAICALCNGTGKYENRVCPSCNGADKYPCDECGGDGYINPGDIGYS